MTEFPVVFRVREGLSSMEEDLLGGDLGGRVGGEGDVLGGGGGGGGG